jgi:hypothetical protein
VTSGDWRAQPVRQAQGRQEWLCHGRAQVEAGGASPALHGDEEEPGRRRGVMGVSSWLAISTPHPGWFFAKSAEALEKKRVEFFVSAKECAIV